jgi:hypothetical protein
MMKITNIQIGEAHMLLKHYLEDKYLDQLSSVAISNLVGKISPKLPSNLNEPPDLNLGLGTSNRAIEYIFERSELSQYCMDEVQKWIVFEKNKKAEFDTAIQSTLHIIKSKNYIIPIYWDQFYYGEFLASYGIKSNKIHTYRLKQLPRITGKEILDWVKREQVELKITDAEAWSSGTIKTVAHHLKVLQIVGVLDLVNEMFTYKYYDPNSTRIGKDKASFLALIMGIPEKGEDVRTRLKNIDELETKPSLTTAKKIFMEHGLLNFFESKEKKIID